MGVPLAAAALVLLLVEEKRASEAREPVEPPQSLRRGFGPMAGVIFPGLILHGAGHALAGDPRTGLRLLAVQGIGAGATLVSLSGIALTGASRRTVAPLAVLGVAGVGMFAASWMADVYGVVATGRARGRPTAFAPAVQARIGLRAVHDPTLSRRVLLGTAWDLRWRALRLSPATQLAPDADDARLSLHAAYRLLGPRPTRSAADGSFLELVTGATHDRYDTERFSLTTGEVEVAGRFDLIRFASSLTGGFVEGGTGFAYAVHRFHTGVRATDVHTLLLARIAFGLYLGHGSGEASLFYDHRHDGEAAGLKTRGLGSGALGHFGMATTFFVSSRWGVHMEAQAGSAYVGGLALVWRTERLRP